MVAACRVQAGACRREAGGAGWGAGCSLIAAFHVTHVDLLLLLRSIDPNIRVHGRLFIFTLRGREEATRTQRRQQATDSTNSHCPGHIVPVCPSKVISDTSLHFRLLIDRGC